jgi:hypothetical protein
MATRQSNALNCAIDGSAFYTGWLEVRTFYLRALISAAPRESEPAA